MKTTPRFNGTASFNETLPADPERGWNPLGIDAGGSAWKRRSVPGVFFGLYYVVLMPGSRSISIAGSGAVKINWGSGNGSGYAIRLGPDGTTLTSVLGSTGRHDLKLTGDTATLTRFDALASPSLCGTLAPFSTLSALSELNLEGTSIRGNIAMAASLGGLRYLNLRGCSGCTYTATTLPDWPEGMKIDAADTALPAAEAAALLHNLAATATTNGRLDLTGTNAPVPAASLADIATLRAKGWVVLHN